MEIKYQEKTLLFESKQKTYKNIKQFVLQQLPQLESKNWTFIYFDSEGDQVILGDNDDFESTIDYYNSIGKNLVLIVKEMWWKHKKVHSKSKLVKELLSKKSTENDDYKVKQFKVSESDSDDEFFNIDFKPGQLYVEDSAKHAVKHFGQKSQTKNKDFVKDKTTEKQQCLAQIPKTELTTGCASQKNQFSVKKNEFRDVKSQVINP